MNQTDVRVHHRWRATGIVLIIALALLVVTTLALILLPQKIRKVKIVGSTIYSDEQILSLCGKVENVAYASLNEKTINRAVHDALPYVHRVTLSFKLPRTLVIHVEEETATYVATEGGTSYLLTSELRLLQEFPADAGVDLSPYIPLALPAVKEPTIGKALTFADVADDGYIHDTLHAIEKSAFKDELSIDLTGKLTISFLYRKRIKVVLGEAEELSTKLSLAAKTYERYKNDLGDVRTARIDVSRLPNPIYSPDVPVSAE